MVYRYCSGPKTKSIKKNLQKVFGNSGLDTIIDAKMKLATEWDVTFDLHGSFCQPFQRPDNRINYIHVESSHAPNSLKQITKTIKKATLQARF